MVAAPCGSLKPPLHPRPSVIFHCGAIPAAAPVGTIPKRDGKRARLWDFDPGNIGIDKPYFGYVGKLSAWEHGLRVLVVLREWEGWSGLDVRASTRSVSVVAIHCNFLFAPSSSRLFSKLLIEPHRSTTYLHSTAHCNSVPRGVVLIERARRPGQVIPGHDCLSRALRLRHIQHDRGV